MSFSSQVRKVNNAGMRSVNTQLLGKCLKCRGAAENESAVDLV